MILKMLSCFALGVIAAATEKSEMYVRKARMEDQTSASSGYAYHSDSDGPTSYVHFSGSSGDFANLGYPPIPIAHYSQSIPSEYESYLHYYPELNHHIDMSNGLAGIDTEAEKYVYGGGKGLEGAEFSGGSGSDFSEGGGEKYDASKYSDRGEKGQTGYKSEEGHDKGSQGKHNSEEHKGHYSKKGGDKEGHHESSEHYGSKNEAAKGSKGASYSESSGHKKGSKTTGYHKVYHKDEYKKDHTFYDESDKRGHFDKYGSGQTHHSDEKGSHEKGGHSDSGFHEDEAGRKGSYDKGHYDVNDSKFNAKEGKSEHHNNEANYAKDHGEEDSKSVGFKKGEESLLDKYLTLSR